MFNKKSEESEWTRFSRALGGPPPAPETQEAPPDDESPTLAQIPPVPIQPEVYQAPPPAPEPDSDPEPIETSWAPPPTPPVAPPVTQVLSQYSPPSGMEQGETILGDGASVDGSIRSERSIRIQGAIQGEIESKQRVVVEEAARVQARIVAESVTVLGEVNGSIQCTGRLEIASSARVTGEVTAGTLIIQEGAFFEGNLKMTNNRNGESA